MALAFPVFRMDILAGEIPIFSASSPEGILDFFEIVAIIGNYYYICISWYLKYAMICLFYII
jgi:hypothetical protein